MNLSDKIDHNELKRKLQYRFPNALVTAYPFESRYRLGVSNLIGSSECYVFFILTYSFGFYHAEIEKCSFQVNQVKISSSSLDSLLRTIFDWLLDKQRYNNQLKSLK